MHITLETDYAVRIVSALCCAGRRMDAGEISSETGVSLRFSLKILRKLVTAGIVKSYKGAQGGYEINAKPEEITLRMVVEATEGTYYFSRCLSPDGSCSKGPQGSCLFKQAFGEISDLVREKLESYDFGDVKARSGVDENSVLPVGSSQEKS